MCYGLNTLATPLDVAKDVMWPAYFKMLSFLGVNVNIRRDQSTLTHAYGGVGLFSFPAKQAIYWINMAIQDFGMLLELAGRKFRALLEALQLKVGTNRNLLCVSYDIWGSLATPYCLISLAG